MAYHLNVSIGERHKLFLEEKHLSPSQLLQIKIDELMKDSPEEFQTKFQDMEKKGMTKWQRALAVCSTYSQRLEVEKQFSKAMGDDKDSYYDELIQKERERESN